MLLGHDYTEAWEVYVRKQTGLFEIWKLFTLQKRMRIHLLVNYTDPDLGFLGHKNFQTPFGFNEKNMF